VPHDLIPHPAMPAPEGLTLAVEVTRLAGQLQLTYQLEGPVQLIKLAAPETPERRDGLWRASCFEMFAREALRPGYREYNFAPSGSWAHYAFTGYREGMTSPHMSQPPEVQLDERENAVTLTTTLPFPNAPALLALTAVIETQEGDKSYWSLAHPEGPPDFHHGDCFVLQLAATDQP
jgi:hypothetical protein